MIKVTIQTNSGIEVNYKGDLEVAGSTLFQAVKPYISKDEEILHCWQADLNGNSLGRGLYDLFNRGQLVKYTIEDY